MTHSTPEIPDAQPPAESGALAEPGKLAVVDLDGGQPLEPAQRVKPARRRGRPPGSQTRIAHNNATADEFAMLRLGEAPTRAPQAMAALIIDALKAAGGISSTLAAGAMAGVHVGATLSGSGAVTASGTDSYSQSTTKSESRNENYNYEGT